MRHVRVEYAVSTGEIRSVKATFPKNQRAKKGCAFKDFFLCDRILERIGRYIIKNGRVQIKACNY